MVELSNHVLFLSNHLRKNASEYRFSIHLNFSVISTCRKIKLSVSYYFIVTLIKVLRTFVVVVLLRAVRKRSHDFRELKILSIFQEIVKNLLLWLPFQIRNRNKIFSFSDRKSPNMSQEFVLSRSSFKFKFQVSLFPHTNLQH